MNTITENHTDRLKKLYMAINPDKGNEKKNRQATKIQADMHAHVFEPELLDAHIIALANLLS